MAQPTVPMYATRDGVTYDGKTHKRGAQFPVEAAHAKVMVMSKQAEYVRELDCRERQPTPVAGAVADTHESAAGGPIPPPEPEKRKRGRPKGSGKYQRRDMTAENEGSSDE